MKFVTSFLDSEYTFPFFGMNPSFSSIALKEAKGNLAVTSK